MIYWTTETRFDYRKDSWCTWLLYSYNQIDYGIVTKMLHDNKEIPDNVSQYFERTKLEFQEALNKANGAVK